ncbi:WD repeat-containing protein 76 isoform X2 [Ornithorhynchus anatinus]|uniref:WD repeat-containing protein 76 isoform X2 n=1 Tax=Ornithorhynchus anatinus TaxID=9258 RepID=UPI0010A7960E|nr:WD repeat-containing protein 76 isoform X2 [Ornithorhynchus anatinus]
MSSVPAEARAGPEGAEGAAGGGGGGGGVGGPQLLENTPKENPSKPNFSPSPAWTAVLTKQARILLTPLSFKKGSGRQGFLPRRILEPKQCGPGENSAEDPGPRTGPAGSQALSVYSKRSREAPRLSPETAAAAADSPQDEEDSDGDERECQAAATLKKMTSRKPPCGVKRKKLKEAADETTPRRSMRLLKADPSEVPVPQVPAQPEVAADERPAPPPGPLEMVPSNQTAKDEVFGEFLQTWTEMSQLSGNIIQQPSSLESYQASLSGMAISKETVCKVTKDRIFSLAVHPSESRLLVAAGDRQGQVGLWDLDQGPAGAGVYTFAPHIQAVSCLYFSPANPAHLLSLSYDGTVRCADFSRAVFEEVYRNEDLSLSSFTFLSDDASSLLVGHWNGGVAVVDRRAPAPVQWADLGPSLVRTIHGHPLHRQYFVAAGARNVAIFDVRCLKPRRNQPLLSLPGHTKSLASAYFSPATGCRVVTTCADDTLRVFDTSCVGSKAPLLTTVRHNNNTGRWLSRFQAIWDPKQEDCFVVGSMSRPRRIEVFHATGRLLHSFAHEDWLGSVCSINALHPSCPVLAGGNSSGKVHVFKA